jgi:magnesium-transporting ATPase (P-type)
VWENLRKVLLINTIINNSQGLSVLFGLLFGLPFSPLNVIQVLYSNLVCATTLGFVCAIEPAEEGIMKQPPRHVGKFLIGRFMFLRILFGTTVLTLSVIASVFWLSSFGEKYASQQQQTALAFNVLDFGAVSVALSCRVFQKSSFSLSLGNKWNSIAITIFVILQLAVTYIPGLNTVVFRMAPMDGLQWGITLLFMVMIFLLMEMEKFVRLSASKKREGISRDDDEEEWIFDEKRNINMVEKASPLKN